MTSKTCPSCGCALSGTQFEGLCPGCLLRAGLSRDDQSPKSQPCIDGYHLIEEIGVGGMGVVYKAEQREPIRRIVAIKLIKLGMDTREVIARFEAERQALAMLNHPNVAAAYHAAATDTGRPYFVMEFVPGESITAFCDRHCHTTRQRLELFLQACEGLQHAHQKAIVHRDIKPSNLLVSLDLSNPAQGNRGPSPLLKVIDFGVAKVAAPNRTGVTQAGQFFGTPEYMSPEQANANPLDVDTRSDIYSLGVVLYELLAKCLPYGARTRSTGSYPGLTGQAEPIRLGMRDTALRGDVEIIVAKAMMKEREQRYASVAELAADIRRYLDDEPIAARRPTVTYQLRKFARRNMFVVVSTGALLVAMLLGTAGTAAGLLHARRERDSARHARQAEQVQRETAIANQRLAEAQEQLAQRRLAQNLITTGRTLLKSGEAARARESFEESWDMAKALKLSELPAVANLLATHIASPTPLIEIEVRSRGRDGQTLGPPTANMCVVFSADGRRLFAGGSDGLLRVWDVLTGAQLTTLRCETGYFRSVASAPDGRTIATGATDGTISLWDAATFERQATLRGHTERVADLAFSDGGRLLSASWDTTIRIWDVPTRSNIAVLRGHTGHVYEVSLLDDTRCLSVSGGGEIKLWDLSKQSEIAALSGVIDEDRTAVAVTPDRQLALVGSANGLELWDLRSASIANRFAGHAGAVFTVAIAPDGSRAASAGVDGTVIVWNLPEKTELLRLTGHIGTVRGLTFSPDGRLLASAGHDGHIKLWPVGGGGECLVARGHQDRITSICTSRDGLTVTTGGFDGFIRTWDLATGECLRSVQCSAAKIWSIASFKDDRRVLVGGEDGTLRVINLADTSELRCLRGHTDVVTCVGLSPDEHFAVSSSRDHTVKLWDIEQGEEIQTFLGHRDRVRSATFSPDGRSVLSGSFDNTLKLWDVSGTATTQTLEGHQHFVHGAMFSADGKSAMSWSWDLSLATWDLASGRRERRLTGPTSWICSGAWSRDGTLIVAGTQDGQLWFWDETSSEPVSNFKAHTDVLAAVALLPDGRVLTGGRDQLLNVYDLSRPAEHRRFATLLPVARRQLELEPGAAGALLTFASWYSFRGFHDYAAELFTQSRNDGAEVSSLAMARCYWRTGKFREAEREFRIARERGEVNAEYLTLCLDAVARRVVESAAPTTPATRP